MKIVFATKNPGKLKEMRQMLAGFDVISSDEAGVSEDIREDGKTFEENACKKAFFVAGKTGMWTLADDSGLCINALNGSPGVYTARWAGEKAGGGELIKKTLTELKGVGKREAYFESVVVLVSPDKKKKVFSGRVFGKIAENPSGRALPKLPYDVVFIPQGCNQTFAQMKSIEKNRISHRGIAFQKLKEYLLSI